MLFTALANSTDAEIIEVNKRLNRHYTKKMIFGIVTSVVIHFASAFLVRLIGRRF